MAAQQGDAPGGGGLNRPGAPYAGSTLVAFGIVLALVLLAGDRMPGFVYWSLILVAVYLGLTNASAVNDLLQWLTGGLAAVATGSR